MTRPHKFSSVVLGFAEQATEETNQPSNFASKAGGLPVWLNRSPQAAAPPPKCGICYQRHRFLAQIYAPVEEEEVGHGEGFHRVLYVSLCENVSCQRSKKRGAVSVLRTQLRRRNEYYEYDGGGEVETGGLDVCDLCGFKADKKCGECKRVSYCSRTCQLTDWKCGHKESCTGDGEAEVQGREAWRFQEVEIVTEAHPTPPTSDGEESESESDNDNEDVCDNVVNGTSIDETKTKIGVSGHAEQAGIVGTFQDADDDELPEDLFRGQRKKDHVFERFQEVVSMAKSQVIRYERGGRPLLVTQDENGIEEIALCELCGAERIFEMQIMPQLGWYLHGKDTKQVEVVKLRRDLDVKLQSCNKYRLQLKEKPPKPKQVHDDDDQTTKKKTGENKSN